MKHQVQCLMAIVCKYVFCRRESEVHLLQFNCFMLNSSLVARTPLLKVFRQAMSGFTKTTACFNVVFNKLQCFLFIYFNSLLVYQNK